MEKYRILLIFLIVLIPTASYAVTEMSISRDAPSTDNYVLFEDHDGIDQFWVDHNGTAYHNGTEIESDLHNIKNVTSVGCANGEFLQVSGTTWGCSSTGGSDNLGNHLATQTLDMDENIIDDPTYIINGSSVLSWPQGGSQVLLGNQSSIHDLVNVTATGCASGEFLTVSGSSWVCGTAGGGGGFTTVYKTADETITNDATLTDDTDLQFAVEANAKYVIISHIIALAENTTPDIKYSWSTPASFTKWMQPKTNVFYSPGNLSYDYDESNAPLTTTFQTDTGWTPHTDLIYFSNGVNAGTVAWQWSQGTSSSFFTTVKEGSFIMYKKLN